ncbi:MAG: nicotinate-nucleotide diphosphorylase (carboxylating), partial [Thermoanaerobaculia bacterium]
MNQSEIDAIVRRALDEDLPDITSDAIFDADERGSAFFLAKASGVLAGLAFAEATFRALDPSAEIVSVVGDGAQIAPGDEIAEVRGSVRALLAGERTALNLVQRASGIATMTWRYVEAVDGTGATIYDTRKTVPG